VETIPQARVLKKDTRADYYAMHSELDRLPSASELTGWATENSARIADLPPDWQEGIRTIIDTKCEWIAEGHEPPPSAEILADEWGDKQAASLRNAMTREEAPPVDETSKWHALGPMKQAGILCADQDFWEFLAVNNEANATQVVYDRCRIKSRRELATDPDAADLWRDLVAGFRMWQRQHEIESPRQEPSAPGHGAGEPEAAAQPPDNPAAASQAHHETAEQYCKRWRAIVDAATNAAQLHKSWGSDKAARNRIDWPDDDTFDKLKADVTKAIEFLKRDAPAGGAIPK